MIPRQIVVRFVNVSGHKIAYIYLVVSVTWLGTKLLLGLSGVSIRAFPAQRAWLDHSVVFVLLLVFIVMTTLAAATVAYRPDLPGCEKVSS